MRFTERFILRFPFTVRILIRSSLSPTFCLPFHLIACQDFSTCIAAHVRVISTTCPVIFVFSFGPSLSLNFLMFQAQLFIASIGVNHLIFTTKEVLYALCFCQYFCFASPSRLLRTSDCFIFRILTFHNFKCLTNTSKFF